MFVTKKQLKKALDNLEVWVRTGFMTQVRAAMQELVRDELQAEVSRRVAKRAEQEAEKAKSDEGRCECPGCTKWRKRFPHGSVIILSTGGSVFQKPKETIDCWGKRIADLEGKLAALLQHQGVEVDYVPESTTSAHWKAVPVAVPVAGPVAPDNRPRKVTRKRR